MMSRNKTLILMVVAAIIIGAGLLFFSSSKTSTYISNATSTPSVSDTTDTVTLAIGQTGTLQGVTLTPRAVVEDSRCPVDVQCIWAGRVRVRATLGSGLGTADQVFLLNDPVTTEAEVVTLINVTPDRSSKSAIADSEYKFTFKVEKQRITYLNASPDVITVELPNPGAVTGEQFKVVGKARGTWFFEASFPVQVVDMDGNILASVPAQAKSDWMTQDFVPFEADITIPQNYTGRATLILKKDNPSDLRANDASISFPINIEY